MDNNSCKGHEAAVDIMADDEFKAIMKERGGKVEKYLSTLNAVLPEAPERLREAMSYSLNAGGKRIRPVLCMSCAMLCGGKPEKVLPFAGAIEMIHTYSLIHDDLPAMDDDDFRRGRLSSHKAFDEATAILAGDGLLTDAFLLMTKTEEEPETVLKAVACFAKAAGSSGMVGGQMLDMRLTGKTGIAFSQVRAMQSLKTGAILEASCVCGAILAGADSEVTGKISAYGRHLGSAFQIVDDILDIIGDEALMGKPKGSDEEMGKITCPSLIGLEKSRELAAEEAEKAIASLDGFGGRDAMFLRKLAQYVVERMV